jgi:hypothetical protein
LCIDVDKCLHWMNLELCLRMYYNGPPWIYTSSSTLKVHCTTWALVSWTFHLIVIWKSQAWFFIVIVLNLLSNLCILMISLSFDLQINRSSSVAHCLEEGLRINSSVCTLLCLHKTSSVYVMFCVYMELKLLNPMTMDWRWKIKDTRYLCIVYVGAHCSLQQHSNMGPFRWSS